MITDVHAHFFPAAVIDFYREHGGDQVQVIETDGQLGMMQRHRPLHPVLPPAFYDVEAHLAGMDDAGADVHALSIPPPMVYWAEPAKGVDLCQQANDALAEVAAKQPSRLVPMAALPLQAPELAVAELQRVVAELGTTTVMIGANIAGTELDDPTLEPFWAEAERLDTAVFVHPIVVDDFGGRLGDFGLKLGLGMVLDTTIAMARMVASGRMDAYPGLRIGWSHLGGTLPFISDRIDYFHEHAPTNASRAEHRFAHYADRFFYDTVVYSPRALRMGLEYVGPDRLMFGTDTPFLGDSTKDIRGFIDGCEQLSDADRETIYAGNPARFLRMNVPSEQPAGAS